MSCQYKTFENNINKRNEKTKSVYISRASCSLIPRSLSFFNGRIISFVSSIVNTTLLKIVNVKTLNIGIAKQ